MRKRIDLQADGELNLDPQYTTFVHSVRHDTDPTPEVIAAEEAEWAALRVVTDESVLNDYLEAEKALVAARRRLLDHAAPQAITDDEREGLAAARLWWAQRRTKREADSAHGVDALGLDWDVQVDFLSEPGPSQDEIVEAIQEALSGDVLTFDTHEAFTEWLEKVCESGVDQLDTVDQDSDPQLNKIPSKKSNETN